MIGIILAISIYRYYYNLAKKYEKKAWKYGLMAIALLYACQFAFGLIYGVIALLTNPDFSEEDLDRSTFSLVNLAGLFFALIIVYIVRQQLEKKFKKEASQNPIEIDQIGVKENI